MTEEETILFVGVLVTLLILTMMINSDDTASIDKYSGAIGICRHGYGIYERIHGASIPISIEVQ